MSGASVSGDLSAHATECAACAATLELAQILHDDREALCERASLPSAGAVFWRATIRARAEAARAVGQPITLLQGIAAAAAVGLFVAFIGSWWRAMPLGSAWLDRVGNLVPQSTSIPTLLILTLAIGAGLILAPIAVYLATADSES